jgi:DNA-binding MarR family transcriptional regulator
VRPARASGRETRAPDSADFSVHIEQKSRQSGGDRIAQRLDTRTDTALVASELREVLGRLIRRLRAEHRFPLGQGAVLGRLDRQGPQGVSDLAKAERMRPQSMAQTVSELEAEGLVERNPDPLDGRRALVELTKHGKSVLEADRRAREGWLAQAIEQDLSPAEQEVLADAAELLRRLAST